MNLSLYGERDGEKECRSTLHDAGLESNTSMAPEQYQHGLTSLMFHENDDVFNTRNVFHKIYSKPVIASVAIMQHAEFFKCFESETETIRHESI